MELHYEFTESDYKLARTVACEYLKKHQRKGYLHTLFNLVIGACVAAALMVSTGLLTENGHKVATEYAFALGFGLLALFATVAFSVANSRNQIKLFVSLMGPFPIEQHANLTAEAISFSSRLGTGIFPLKAIREIIRLQDHVALIVRPASAIVVPFSAFRSESERDAFIQAVSSQVAA